MLELRKGILSHNENGHEATDNTDMHHYVGASKVSESIPQLKMFAVKRKGRMAAIDALVKALWKSDLQATWPELSFRELTSRASELVGYELKQPTVRSYIYKNPEIFLRVRATSSRPMWCLASAVRKNE